VVPILGVHIEDAMVIVGIAMIFLYVGVVLLMLGFIFTQMSTTIFGIAMSMVLWFKAKKLGKAEQMARKNRARQGVLRRYFMTYLKPALWRGR
jgi:fatty acid desaturase